ncbi:MAG: LysM peptidoglycan-binding domain-containing protein [Acetivibrionales bacterium]|jgi:N-acetylmuramoyl-L-alanine amidase
MFYLKKAKTFMVTAGISLCLFFILSNTASAAPYTVRQGDTLYQLGKLFNISASVIKQNNKLSSNMIYPGQVLDIPCATYTVKRGDTLYLIATRNGVSLNSLRKANNKWDNYIYPGQRILIPGKASAVSANPSRGSVARGVIPYTSSDVDLLSRLIMAEAENQPYNAKVAVGAVVVNRVQSSEFPDSISDVIHQRISGYYQFTPVENGWINRAASQDAINAAYDALRGVDPSNEALFYFDDSSTNKWLWSKPVTAWIGRMVFVR